MCTGLALATKDNKHLFGRNLDVPATYGQSVHIIPRNYEWVNVVNGETYTSKYACIGMGIVVDRHPFMFDLVNEKGLAGAGLNFTHFAKFSEKAVEGKTSISGSDFPYWAVSNFSNLDELKEALKGLVITSIPVKPGFPVAGLHWMFTDLSGRSIVIESMEDGMHIHDNPVGTLTNDPTFPWHLINLRQYATLTVFERASSYVPDGKYTRLTVSIRCKDINETLTHLNEIAEKHQAQILELQLTAIEEQNKKITFKLATNKSRRRLDSTELMENITQYSGINTVKMTEC